MAELASKLNFTKAALQTLPSPASGKRATYYDTKTRGLNLVVTDSGTKTFYLRRKLHGASERVVIGRFPDLTVEQARGKAGELNAAFASGQNPADLRRAARAELTLGQLFEEYIERYAKHHTKTWKEMEASFRRYLGHWQRRKLSTINKADVQKLHAQLGKDKGPHTANRTLELLRAMFNKGITLGWCANHNPAVGTSKFKLRARDRFLQSDELARFFRALAEESNHTIRDYVLASLLSGARKSNVLAMRWEELHFERGTWTIPETKNGEAHTIPLTMELSEVLKARAERRVNDYVFAGSGKTGHLLSPKKGWKRILKRAQIMDLRLHDLRRTLGSWQAATGATLVVIGKTLGHKDVSTTAIYSRLSLDPVRTAMEAATAAMFAAGGILAKAEVVSMKKQASSG